MIMTVIDQDGQVARGRQKRHVGLIRSALVMMVEIALYVVRKFLNGDARFLVIRAV